MTEALKAPLRRTQMQSDTCTCGWHLEVAARAHALDTIINGHPVRNDQPTEAPLFAQHLMKEAIRATQGPSVAIALTKATDATTDALIVMRHSPFAAATGVPCSRAR